uniref:Ribosome biogenesis protein bop1-A (Trinotate prediction) n=1 Tax=Henneguya salminicola TaxID=69463 RepID=A0A6G3MFV2_HENSL
MNKIDDFLYQKDNPDGGISIYNPGTKKYEVLNDEEIDLVEKLRQGTFTDPNYNPYSEYIDYFTGQILQLPINCMPEPKSRFVASASENRKILKLIVAIRKGLKQNKTPDNKIKKYSDIWSSISDTYISKNNKKRLNMNWRAPKPPLPSTYESYHPPLEYLPDNEELNEWNSLNNEQKRAKFIPSTYKCLRHVPYYDLISQNYDRCLDLYMAPRKRKMITNIDPDDLLPQIPDPQSLRPFPSWESIVFTGHNSRVTCISVHRSGELLVSGDASGLVIVWEHMGVELKRYQFKSPITAIEWNPRIDLFIITVAL